MKQCRNIFLLFLLMSISFLSAQETNDYIEFNDRRSVVHGVYLGVTMHYGEINNKSSYFGSIKLAYVANQKFEIGFATNIFYSEQSVTTSPSVDKDLIGAYAGLHLEPILFSKSTVNLSFPLLIGGGIAGYVDKASIENDNDIDLNEKNSDEFFIIEPGINVLFNISRYLQIETGIKYRITEKINLVPSTITRINNLSFGVGIKIGVFNLGKNRYKKHL